MLRIRLQRTGRRNIPTYRIVVAEKSHAVKGKSLETVGHFLPNRDPVECKFEEDRITHWISKGAQPTDTVARLLKRMGMKNMEKFMQSYTKKKPKGEEAAPAAAAAPAEAKTEEPKKEEAAPEGDTATAAA